MNLSKKKILVVDDEIGIRDALSNLLRNKGHEVFMAANGPQALAMLDSTKPDLIFLDYQMPQMNGLETLRKIREFDRTVRVVMLTAFGTPLMEKEALKLGVDAFLHKEFSAFIKGMAKLGLSVIPNGKT